MKVRSVKTEKILAGRHGLFKLLDKALPPLGSGDIVAITSKVVSLCENSVLPIGSINKENLVIQESDLYLPSTLSKYRHHFTITDNTLIPMAGIDESNGDGNYVLWPKDSQKSANGIRAYLSKRTGGKKIGVIITDSTCQPLRRGTSGISLAHSGFEGLINYIGSSDLFGRPLEVTQANIASGLAAAAVLAMGEGAEQTPICVISEVPFIKFQSRNPTVEELAQIYISTEEDLFASFLTAVHWQQGKRKRK